MCACPVSREARYTGSPDSKTERSTDSGYVLGLQFRNFEVVGYGGRDLGLGGSRTLWNPLWFVSSVFSGATYLRRIISRVSVFSGVVSLQK